MAMKQRNSDPPKVRDMQKKKNRKVEFEFCKVCRLNQDKGQNHKYLPKHKSYLSAFLSRFQSKLTDVRFFLKNPKLLRPEHASRNRVWCVFCEADFEEFDSSFACENAIDHFASAEHLKNLKHFLWKHGGAMDNVDTFRFLEADLIKWKNKCKLLTDEAASTSGGSHVLPLGSPNDIHNQMNYGKLTNYEQTTLDPFKSKIFNGVIPLQYNTNEYQISHSRLLEVTNAGQYIQNGTFHIPVETLQVNNENALRANENGQHLFYPNGNESLCPQVYQDQRAVKEISSSQEGARGNVHTGAPPPWFGANDETQLDAQQSPSCSSLISLSNKSGKSSKLNPKRVGAAWAEKRKLELEMEKRGEIVQSVYDDKWLPSFGRVWQSGSRKESKKEFEMEKQKGQRVEAHSNLPVEIKPYVSKRMRKEQVSGSCGDYNGAKDDCGDNHI